MDNDMTSDLAKPQWRNRQWRAKDGDNWTEYHETINCGGAYSTISRICHHAPCPGVSPCECLPVKTSDTWCRP